MDLRGYYNHANPGSPSTFHLPTQWGLRWFLPSSYLDSIATRFPPSGEALAVTFTLTRPLRGGCGWCLVVAGRPSHARPRSRDTRLRPLRTGRSRLDLALAHLQDRRPTTTPSTGF